MDVAAADELEGAAVSDELGGAGGGVGGGRGEATGRGAAVELCFKDARVEAWVGGESEGVAEGGAGLEEGDEVGGGREGLCEGEVISYVLDEFVGKVGEGGAVEQRHGWRVGGGVGGGWWDAWGYKRRGLRAGGVGEAR